MGVARPTPRHPWSAPDHGCLENDTTTTRASAPRAVRPPTRAIAGHDRRVQLSAAAAIANAHAWFELNSGWAPPDEDTLAEWVNDGVCRCPDDCLVAPDGWCVHGLASWWLILGALT